MLSYVSIEENELTADLKDIIENEWQLFLN